MDSSELKKLCVDKIEQICVHLYPNGKERNGNWWIGDIQGSAGNSFGICIKDNRNKGLGYEFNASGGSRSGHDIFDMWMAVKGCSFKEALSQIHQYLGIVEEIQRPLPVRKPTPFDLRHLLSSKKSPVQKYLEDRGINADTQRKYKVAACNRRQSEYNEHFIAYQHETPDGEKLLLKYKGIRRLPDGKQETGVHKIENDDPMWSTLFGWWLVNDDTREIVITEGQEDAMACSQIVGDDRLPVLSLPMGVANMDWIDRDWTTLQHFERITLWFDNDTDKDQNHGQIAAKKVAQRLGLNRVYTITTKHKDANDLLLNGEPEELEWHDIYKSATRFDLEEITEFGRNLEESIILIEEWNKEKPSKFVFPSAKFEYRNGETTAIVGSPGHGKSQFLYQSHVHEMKMGERVLIASLEIPMKKMRIELARIMLGRYPKNKEEMYLCAEWAQEKVWFYNKPDKKGWKEVIKDFEYGTKRYGISRFIVDSMHFLVRKEQYEEQDEFSDRFCNFDRDNDVHTAIVAHSRKLSEELIPNMSDLEGSGGPAKAFDNIVTVWRNNIKNHPDDYDSGDRTGPKIKRLLEGPDGIMRISKQRATGDLFDENLWFDKISGTFHTDFTPRWTPVIAIENDF